MESACQSASSEEKDLEENCVKPIMLKIKLGYFLGLNDKIAPLIDIIYRVVYDIGWFSLILLLMTLAFAYTFVILGKS